VAAKGFSLSFAPVEEFQSRRTGLLNCDNYTWLRIILGDCKFQSRRTGLLNCDIKEEEGEMSAEQVSIPANGIIEL